LTYPARSTPIPAINAAGLIVGYYIDDSGSHGFLLDVDGSYTTVDVPGATSTDAHGINDTAARPTAGPRQ
jgi:hypothetical protein